MSYDLENKLERDTKPVTLLELARVIERIHRRYADLLRVDLMKLGVDDVSPHQVMILFTIGGDELSIRDLLDRGHLLGSSASYNLKQLVEASYIERETLARDKRSARIRLTPRGRELCDKVSDLHEGYHRLIARDPDETLDMEITFCTLRRLEDVWTTTLRNGGLFSEVAVRRPPQRTDQTGQRPRARARATA